MAKRAKVVEIGTITSNDVDKLHTVLGQKAILNNQEMGLKDRFKKQFPTGGTMRGTNGRFVVVEKQDRRELKKVATMLALLKLYLSKKLTAKKLADCVTLNAEKLEQVTSGKFVEQHVAARKKVLAVKTGKDK